ncbi:MAG: hypothetical protein AAF707_04225 [Pseudomonadota bacterium]
MIQDPATTNQSAAPHRPATPREQQNGSRSQGQERLFRQALREASKAPVSEAGGASDEPLGLNEEGSHPARPIVGQGDARSGQDLACSKHDQRHEALGLSTGQTSVGAPERAAAQVAQEISFSQSEAASSNSELLTRIAAALETPLKSLRLSSEAAFLVSIPGNSHAADMIARIESSQSGKLAIALTVPGVSISQKRILARDLKAHLTERGWRDCSLRVDGQEDQRG